RADGLPEIAAPPLLICGDEDPSLGPMRVIAEKIKHAEFVLLSPAGHFGNRDQPGTFNRAILDFMARLAGLSPAGLPAAAPPCHNRGHDPSGARGAGHGLRDALRPRRLLRHCLRAPADLERGGRPPLCPN